MKPGTALNTENFIAQLSIDCVVFGYADMQLHVLISEFLLPGNIWTLPGGFIGQAEGIEDAAKRILHERTGLENIYLEQFKVFGQSDRVNEEVKAALEKSPGLLSGRPFPLNAETLNWLSERFISIGFYALVDINKVTPRKTEMDESVAWHPIDELPAMIMDHNAIALEGLKALRENLDNKLIAFNLLPETFTMRELQELYETVYDRPFPRNNFQKKILDMDILDRLEKQFTGAQNRAPYIYRVKQKT